MSTAAMMWMRLVRDGRSGMPEVLSPTLRWTLRDAVAVPSGTEIPASGCPYRRRSSRVRRSGDHLDLLRLGDAEESLTRIRDGDGIHARRQLEEGRARAVGRLPGDLPSGAIGDIDQRVRDRAWSAGRIRWDRLDGTRRSGHRGHEDPGAARLLAGAPATPRSGTVPPPSDWSVTLPSGLTAYTQVCSSMQPAWQSPQPIRTVTMNAPTRRPA